MGVGVGVEVGKMGRDVERADKFCILYCAYSNAVAGIKWSTLSADYCHVEFQ